MVDAMIPRAASMMFLFYAGVFLLSGATLMYEVVLTRLLSVVCWYYLAFVSVSLAMFGMTAGALWVQLRPQYFTPEAIPRRLADAALAAAVTLPLALLTLLAIPVEISYALETLFSFLLFTAVISVPFCFSGMAVCLALTRTALPVGRVYAVDLAGAALGCLGAIGLMKLLDAPSAILVTSGLLFVAAAALEAYAGGIRAGRWLLWAFILVMIAGANALTPHGIQPIWSKGHIDPRTDVLAEQWNPISRVRVTQVPPGSPYMWGASPHMPKLEVEYLKADIDSDAATPIYRFHGDPGQASFVLYDVTSLAVQMRPGGSAAIIGMGGGRDVLAAAAMHFHRIVGIEVNEAIAELAMNRFGWYSGLNSLPQLEVHREEGRSYLTTTRETFDVIQASMVDTWAATSAGALTLTENALYTVDAWRIFYEHLKPGGLLTVSRWNAGSEAAQTERQFSLAVATLLSEGVANPADHLALVGSGRVATLLMSNRPLSGQDLFKLGTITTALGFEFLYVPGEPPRDAALRPALAARTPKDLAQLRNAEDLDISPTYDSAPFFFNSMRLRRLPQVLASLGAGGNLRAMAFLLCFFLAAAALLLGVVVLPLLMERRSTISARGTRGSLAAGVVYFVAIGLGFLLVEMAMMQQLSLLLGHPIYSLAVVLAGLILSSGLGSFVSGSLREPLSFAGRVPAAAACLLLAGYAFVVLPLVHTYAPHPLWQRIGLALALVAPCGIAMGFCFPLGFRRMAALGHESSLPWMWALNGSASVLATFLAVILSMETSITTTALAGAGCYALAALVWPGSSREPAPGS